MKKIIFSIAVLLLSINFSFAQVPLRNCGTVEYYNAQLAADPGLAQRRMQIENFTQNYVANPSTDRSVVTIPVVVHVVYNTSAQNISDALINAQIAQLNADYARLNSDAGNTPSAFSSVAVNTNIQFCLAQRDPSGAATTGIIRSSTSVTSFSTNDNVKHASTGGQDAWSSSSYLNLWVCNLGGGLLGYAQFPGGAAATDGVVVLYSSVGSIATPGTASPYNFGRTATHEVGHWLNLNHIWGDDGTACSGTDNVSDTPNQAGENYGAPAFPHTDACTPSSPGVMFMNYMDYTDDNAMNMFTSGQSSRMNALFVSGGSRFALTTSLGCTPPSGGSCTVPSALTATAITTTTATLNWGAVTGAASYNVQYMVTGGSNWTTTTSTTNSKALSGLTANTSYTYQIQTVCSGTSSSSYSTTATFTTSAASGNCTSSSYESNNTKNTSATIVANTDLFSMIQTSTDVDWYKFTTTTAAMKVKITLTNLPADYDVVLYKGTAQVGIGQLGGTSSETIIYNATAAGTFYIKVYGYSSAYSATTCYDLKAQTSATNFSRLSGEVDGTFNSEKVALHLFPNPASDVFTVNYISSETGNVTIDVIDVMGKIVMEKTDVVFAGDNSYYLKSAELANGLYMVRVSNGDDVQMQKLMIQK